MSSACCRKWDETVAPALKVLCGLTIGITLCQKRNDKAIRSIAFTNRILNEPEKSYSVGEQELPAVLRGLQLSHYTSTIKTASGMCKAPNIETNKKTQLSIPAIQRTTIEKASKISTFWRFNTTHHQKNTKFSSSLIRHPLEKASSGEIPEEDIAIEPNIELFIIIYQYTQKLSWKQILRVTGRSPIWF